jgi:hypothetical protein
MEQEIHFTARNIGGVPHHFMVPINLDDSLVRTDTLDLQPGERKIITARLVAGMAGWKRIGVGDTSVGYKAYDTDTASLLLDLSMTVKRGDSLVRDRSGFSNDGEIAGDEEKRAEGACSMENGRLLFGDCYIEVPGSPGLDRMGETITMMTWVKPAGAGESGRGLVDLFSKGDNHVLQVVGGRQLTFFAGGWGRGDCTVDLPSDWLGHWHHIAGVCEGSKLYVYIDGILKGEANVEGRVNLSVSNRWNLGRNEEFPGERIFKGNMDRAKVFAEPLSKEEIAEIYKTEAGDGSYK